LILQAFLPARTDYCFAVLPFLVPPGEFAVNHERGPRRAGVQRTVTRRSFLQTLAAGAGASALLGPAARVVCGYPERVPLSGLPHAGLRHTVAPTALVLDEVSRCHLTGVGRPECPQRYEAVRGSLAKSPFFGSLKIYEPRPATDEEILACHTPGYLQEARQEIESGCTRLSTGDTIVCRDSLKAAHYASGAACVAVQAVAGGQARNAFCVVRPPGHHATPDRGMGFCIFNNAGIAARYAQQKHGLGKVLIIDWDVHHGNGTQEIFYEDPSVFYFSTHQAPWYPGTGTREETGRGKGLGTTLNWPMVQGSGRREFLPAFQALAAAADRFKPELVIISAGFDARHGDPLGRLELHDDDYVELTGQVLQIARQHAGGRVVSVLEGGYNVTGLARAATAHCGRLQQG
jgi:acetoin utilization deacetylase AcuC-like enzyme